MEGSVGVKTDLEAISSNGKPTTRTIPRHDLLSIILTSLVGRNMSSEVGKCTAPHLMQGSAAIKDQLEASLYKLIQNSDCSADDVEIFSTTLNYMVGNCGYSLNDAHPSLLISAAQYNNVAIVVKLLLDHDALYNIRDPNNQETIFHIACQHKSVLRYVYALLYPKLLAIRDINGNLPLHIACHNNDIHFISWIFKSVVSRDRDTIPSISVRCAVIETVLTEEIIASQLTPSLLTVKYSNITAVNSAGNSVYQIAVSNGYIQLLSLLLKILESMHDAFQMHVAITSDFENQTTCTPLELAIVHQQTECLKLLLEFLNKHGMLQKVVQDGRFVKLAANVGDANIMKLLVKYGFSQGLEEAIGKVQDQQLKRLLLYYYTQLTSAKAIMETQLHYKKGLAKGQVEWNGATIETLDFTWIKDALNAMKTIYQAISHADASLHDLSTIQQLASECLKYFDSGTIYANTTEPLIAITRIDITQCSLKCVPSELFQLPKLEILNLSCNSLQEIPSALYTPECIYSSQSLRKLVLDGNKLKTLPEDLFLGLVNSLEHLSVHKNELTELPPGLWVMPHLKELNLSENKLSQLHYLCDRTSIDDPNFSEEILSTLNRFSLQTITSQEFNKHNSITRYLQQLHMFYATLHRATGGKFIIKDIHKCIYLLHEQIFKHKIAQKPYIEAESNLTQLIFNEIEETSVLSSLNLSQNKFSEVPHELPCLAPNLLQLDMRYNKIKYVNLFYSMPRNVATIRLDHNCIEDMATPQPCPSVCSSPCMLLKPRDSSCCTHATHNQLRSLVALSIGYNKLRDFQAVDIDTFLHVDVEKVMCSVVVHFPQLSILSLEHNELTSVPPSILNLTSLNSLNLAHNTGIVSLPSRLGLLSLSTLNLEGLSLAEIPISLIQKPSPRYLLGFLKGICLGKESYRHMKLMLMGPANAGKTTLLLHLAKKGKMVHQRAVQVQRSGQPLSTVGVELGQWEYSPKRNLPNTTFMTWDFGGQEEYYATHQCFISHRSLYLVVWDALEGEAGLRNIKTWLENIEARAPNAPVIVIGTHADCIKNTSALEEAFKRLYVEYNHNTFAYPQIQPQCFFVNSFNSSDMNQLRNYIYDFAKTYKNPSARKDAPPLLEEPIPSYYLAVLKIIQSMATMCNDLNRIPIFTREDYLKEVYQCGYAGNTQEIVEASSFWHDNGIILHHKGITMDELYCVDPQWLCATMANVITVKERNPFQKNGFMHIEDFSKLCNDPCITSTQSFISAIISIMQSFEVILLLDQQSILIPSLMSQQRENACAITANNYGKISLQSNIGPLAVPITTQKDVLLRHYILPFIPNGFISRLISRICTVPNITAQCKSMLGAFNPWWSCWRDGVCLICNDAEILRIVPVTYPLPGTEAMYMVTSSGNEVITRLSGIEVRVISSLSSQDGGPTADPNDDMRAATWLLQQAIECIDSIFNDWYIAFGRKRGFELSMIRQCVPCNRCETQRHSRLLSDPCNNDTSSQKPSAEQSYFLFSSSFCALTVALKHHLLCPQHGCVNVFEIAPDLMFGDLSQSLIHTAENVMTTSAIGKGGFGSVFSGSVGRNVNESQRIAIKKYVWIDGPSDTAESLAWELYQEASREARVMSRLVHDNILGLVGVAMAPLMLLLELAPLGDLKACAEKFQKVKANLNVWTLSSTLIQVAKALDYIHSKNFIFRDLKPSNILVWKFPLPETQFNSESEVYVKLADYGICQQYTPQGVRGVDGTPPYLPPEVLLHGGQQSHSTKLDVYSFGMLMYYLFTFENPFQNETRPISSLLEMGRRPSLSFKQCPPSLWLLELMCWCWSEHPYHRPDIKEVLTVLENGVTKRLVSAFPISGNDAGIVAACAVLKNSSLLSSRSCEAVHTAPAPGYLSPFSHNNMVHELPKKSPSLDVWCACKDGPKRIECQATGQKTEDVEPPEGECLSMVCTPNDQVWVSTALSTGGQLNIYDAKKYHKTATWCSRDPIKKLLYNSAEDIIVAMAKNYLYVFSVHDGTKELKPILSHPTVEGFIEVAIVGVAKKGYEVDLWYSVNTTLKAMEVSMDGITEITLQQWHNGSIVEHMAPLNEVDSSILKYLMISHGSFIEKWNVDKKKLFQSCNCYKFGSELYTENYNSSKVTSLLHWRDVLYVGTEGGVLLALNPGDLTALWTVNASKTPIKCMIGTSLESKNVKSLDCKVPGMIISFGSRYTGVYRGAENVPPSLNPPEEPDISSPRIKLLTTPSLATYMFMWSPVCSRDTSEIT